MYYIQKAKSKARKLNHINIYEYLTEILKEYTPSRVPTQINMILIEYINLTNDEVYTKLNDRAIKYLKEF